MGNGPSNQPQALLELVCGAGRVGVFAAVFGFDVERVELTGTAKLGRERGFSC